MAQKPAGQISVLGVHSKRREKKEGKTKPDENSSLFLHLHQKIVYFNDNSRLLYGFILCLEHARTFEVLDRAGSINKPNEMHLAVR